MRCTLIFHRQHASAAAPWQLLTTLGGVFGPLLMRLTRKSLALALLALLATAVSPVRAAEAPDPLVCDRSPQVRDAIVASVGADCAYVTDVDLAGIGVLILSGSSIEILQEGDFAGLTALRELYLNGNELTELPEEVFAGLTALTYLYLSGNSLTALPEGIFAQNTKLKKLDLARNRLSALPEGIFAQNTKLKKLVLARNRLSALPEGIFAQNTKLKNLRLQGNRFMTLPGGIFSGLAALENLDLSGNLGVFRPIANAGADQTAVAGQVVALAATVSDDDPWGDNVSYAWRRTDDSGSDLTLMDAETASLSFVMPEGATELEFELVVTGRGGVVDTDSLKVRHPDAVVTLTGPVWPADPSATTEIVENEHQPSLYLQRRGLVRPRPWRAISRWRPQSMALRSPRPSTSMKPWGQRRDHVMVLDSGRNIPGPIGRLLAVALSLSAAAEGRWLSLGRAQFDHHDFQLFRASC